MVGGNESDWLIFVVGSLGTQLGLWGENVSLWFL